MRFIDLTEFSARLGGDSNGAMKALLLHDNGGEVLLLRDSEEFAQLCAALTVRTFPPSKSDILQRIAAGSGDVAPGSDLWAEHFIRHEADFPFDRYQRTKDGKVKFHPNGLPLLTGDDNKLGALLSNPYGALASLDLDSDEVHKNLNAYLVSRSTHPAKLSYANASGSLAVERLSEPYSHSVTETDFLTVQTETFAVHNAALQAAALLFLARVALNNEVVRLHDLYRRSDLMASVSRHWTDRGISSRCTSFLSRLSEYRAQPVLGEPQVFVGAVPEHRCVSVFTPFSLFKEVARAKLAIGEELEEEHEKRRRLLDDERQRLEAEIESARLSAQTTVKPTKEARETHKQRVAELKEQLAAVSKELKAAPQKPFFKSFDLLYGGSTPRNLAAELDTSIHRANVLLFVPVSRQSGVDQAERRSFHGRSLLRGRVSLPDKQPACLRPDATDHTSRQWRKRLFGELVSQRAAPLLELQAFWLSRHDELLGEAVLSEQAATLEQLDAPERAFIVRGAGVPVSEKATYRQVLAKRLAESASEALHGAYSGAYSAAHFEELLRCAEMFVQQEGV